MNYEGFGIVLDSSVKWRPNAAVLFMDTWYLSDQYGRETYKTYCEDGGLDPEEDESKEEFVESYENELYCNNGIEALIVDYINDYDCNHAVKFKYEDWCIHVPATIPEDEEQKKNMLTQDDITKILQKYFSVLLDENSPCDIKWLEIHG